MDSITVISVLDAGESKFKAPADSVSSERSLPLTVNKQLSSCLVVSSDGGGSKGAIRGLFSKGSHPIHEDSMLMTNHLPKAPPPHTITLQVRISSCGFGGTQTFS